MSRQLCRYDLQLLCVNNYRGEDYNKPDIAIDCEICVCNPSNINMKKDISDTDKVIFEDKDFTEVSNQENHSQQSLNGEKPIEGDRHPRPNPTRTNEMPNKDSVDNTRTTPADIIVLNEILKCQRCDICLKHTKELEEEDDTKRI